MTEHKELIKKQDETEEDAHTQKEIDEINTNNDEVGTYNTPFFAQFMKETQPIIENKFNNCMKSSFQCLRMFLILTGISLSVSPVFSKCGILTGHAGLDYYAEVHQSKWNSFIHTLGMPFTVYGISCWFPTLFCLNNEKMNKMQLYVWYMLSVHYLSIDFMRGMLCIMFYIYPAYKSYLKTKNSKSTLKLAGHGLAVSTGALLVQEVIGHYLGGDAPSRAEGVFNAILYAIFYSTYHIL